MRGAYREHFTYLTGSRHSDRITLWIMLGVLLTFSMGYTVYDTYTNNPSPTWESVNHVNLSTSTLFMLLVYIPVSFYIIQMLRMAYYYCKGYEQWHGGSADFDTLEVNVIMDLCRAIVILGTTAIGCGLITWIMQPTSLRTHALGLGIYVTGSVILMAVIAPMTIVAMQKLRMYNLRRIETYRQLGGDEYDTKG